MSSGSHDRDDAAAKSDPAGCFAIPVLTEQERTIESVRQGWAASATKIARAVSGLSAEDFAKKSGVSESRQVAFERANETPKQVNPRVQLDKLAAWPFESLLAVCRGLLGDRAIIAEVTPVLVTLGDAGRSLTKESSEAVLASLAPAQTPGTLRALAREARELAAVAMGVALAAEAEEARLAALSLKRVGAIRPTHALEDLGKS